MWITDPIYQQEYLARENGEYKIGESFLTISLGEPLCDQSYKESIRGSRSKLIAAIIER